MDLRIFKHRRLMLIFCGTVLSHILFRWLTGYVADDAYITFRYAENLAAGDGFVYNIGEYVLGTTTPLFTIILAAFVRIGIAPLIGSAIIGVLCAGGVAVIVHRYAQLWRFGRYALIPVIVYALFPRVLSMNTAGMETALFTLLVIGALYLRQREQPICAVALASLATLTRPEGLLLLGLLVADQGFRNPRRIFQSLVISGLILFPWIVFAQFYFGSPIPNSITAKLALYSRFGTMSPLSNLMFLLGWHNPLGIALTLFSFAGGWWLLRYQKAGVFELIWMAGMIGGLTFSRTHLFLWYPVPVYPIWILLGAAAIPLLESRVTWLERFSDRSVRVVVMFLLVGLLGVSVRTIRGYRAMQDWNAVVLEGVGRYLKANAHPDDVVAAEDIGHMGYFSGLRIIDRDGLVTAEAVPYNRAGDYLGLILDTRPDWVVAMPENTMSLFVDSAAFTSRYRAMETFGSDAVPSYTVYVRADKALK